MGALVKAIIMSGSNLGNRAEHLMSAKHKIEKTAGTVIHASAVYQTEPWNMSGEPEFLNQALLIVTSVSAHDLLEILSTIEHEMGRTRNLASGSRTLDLDLIFYSDAIINEPNLVVPHPRMHLRRFNLLPINEIAPKWVHPVLKAEIHELLLKCPDSLSVREYHVSA